MEEVIKSKGLYPVVPRDPVAYRLFVCSEILETIRVGVEDDAKKRDEKLRKHSRLRMINMFSTAGASVLSISGAGISSTGLGVVVGVPLIGVGVVLCLASIITTAMDKEVIKKFTTHEKLISLGQAKFSSLQGMISKALSDENISDEEFKKISDERESYNKQRLGILRPSKKGLKRSQSLKNLTEELLKAIRQSKTS